MDIVAVLNAARSADNTTRSQAEAYLSQYEAKDSAGYFLSLAALLKDESKAVDIRQLAALVMKRALDAEDDVLQRRKHQRWLDLAPNVKVQVRNDLVAALGSSSEDTRNGAAQAVAKAGAIDIPENAWPDLIPGLLGAVANAALGDGIKAATLRALGYLLEELGLETIGQDVVNQILTAIVDGMGAEKARDVRRASVSALEHALDFASENFTEAHVAERNAIMTAVCTCTQAADEHVRSGAFLCITRVAQLYYDNISMYMDTLAQLTFAAARGAQDDTAVQAVEFWTVVAEEEAGRGDHESTRNYTKAALVPLVNLLLELMSQQEEDDDDDSFSKAQAAGVCLTAVAAATQDAVLAPVMPFVQSGFADPNWHKREAATLAFGIICEGPSDDALRPLITAALPPLLQRLLPGTPTFDASAPVRDTSAWVVGHIMEVSFGLLNMSAETFGFMMSVLNAALEDEARVAENVAFAINNIGQQMAGQQAEDGTTPMSPHLMTIIGHLLTRADKDDRNDRNLRIQCYTAIMSVVEGAGSADAPLLMQLLVEAGRRLEAAFSRPPPASPDDREELQSLVVQTTALIQTLAIALGEGVKPAADALVPLLLRVLDFGFSPAFQESYRAIGAVVEGVGPEFVRFAPAVVPRIAEGLKAVEDAQTCIAAVYTVGDLARGMEESFAPFCGEIVHLLLRNVQLTDAQRDIKPPSLSVFGDMAMAVGVAFEPHVGPVMQILDMAAATVNPRKGEDTDVDEYIRELRQAITEAWVGVFQGWNNPLGAAKRGVLMPYVPRVVAHVETWARELIAMPSEDEDEEAEHIRLEISKGLVGLVGDIGVAMDRHAVQNSLRRNMDWVRRLLEMEDALERASWDGETHDDDGDKKETAAEYARKNLV